MENETAKKPKLLLVDDEPHVVENLKIRLENDFDVKTANSVDNALEMLKRIGDIKIIISDQRMKGKEGSDLLKAVSENYPDIVRIMLTGFPEYDTAYKAIKDGKVFDYIIKEGGYLNSIVKTALKAYEWYNTQKEMRMLRELAHQNSDDEVIQLEKSHGVPGLKKNLLLKSTPDEFMVADRYYLNMKYHANKMFNVYAQKETDPELSGITYKSYYLGEVYIGEKLKELLKKYCDNKDVEQLMAQETLSEADILNLLIKKLGSNHKAENVLSQTEGLRNIIEELMFYNEKKWLLIQHQGNRVMFKLEERTLGDKVVVPKYLINDGTAVTCKKSGEIIRGFDSSGEKLGKAEELLDKLVARLI